MQAIEPGGNKMVRWRFLVPARHATLLLIRGSEHAQGLIEFALIAPSLILIFLGVVDYSRFMYFNQAIVNAARAGGDTAINHCAFHATCGMIDTPVGDDFIVQSVYCDAAPYVQLQPQAATCASCLTTNCNSLVTICNATCLASICTKDICINPLAATRNNGMDVTITVGYSWKPITPLIATFFPDKACWSQDPASNHHTLCASATGNVY
jgi:Flp pilus assembly protein TadG